MMDVESARRRMRENKRAKRVLVSQGEIPADGPRCEARDKVQREMVRVADVVAKVMGR